MDLINYLSAGYVHVQDPNEVRALSADGLAPDGVRPSAGTALTIKSATFLLHIS